MSLKIKYMGLELSSPVIAASSPLTSSVDRVVQLADHGIGAVVLKSVFEEQIAGEAAFIEKYSDYPEAADYLRGYVGGDYLRGHIDLIKECRRRTRVPVIASINCTSAGAWTDYARAAEDAGADAIQVNIFVQPSGAGERADGVEKRYLDTVAAVAGAVGIPVSVKLGMRFTNILNVAQEIYYRKARGVVMFNRMFEPDIDVEAMSVVSAEPLSGHAALHESLRSVALCASAVPALDIAAATGVHTGEDVVKAMLAGACAVEICTAIYRNGPEVIGAMNDYVARWMDSHNFASPDDFRGRLRFHSPEKQDEELWQRVQYMKFFPK